MAIFQTAIQILIQGANTWEERSNSRGMGILRPIRTTTTAGQDEVKGTRFMLSN